MPAVLMQWATGGEAILLNTSTFEVGANAYFYYSPYLTSDPWSGIPKVVADNKGVNSSLVTAGRLSSVLPV